MKIAKYILITMFSLTDRRRDIDSVCIDCKEKTDENSKQINEAMTIISRKLTQAMFSFDKVLIGFLDGVITDHCMISYIINSEDYIF